jgi:NAD(P)-dependent dehydrogenase (short-subunit alcohol dehydrogenase family)
VDPDFAGRVALVTGAARGIGLATARLLARRGATVALADRDEARLERALEEVAGAGPAPAAVVCDVTDPAAVNGRVDEVVERYGRIDVLVNNAGVAGRSVPTWELTDDDWASVVGTNLFGSFFFMRAVIPTMRAAHYGRIVNVASIAGKEGNPNAVPYSASKAGVIGLTKAVAKEVATEGVLVNCVTPAVIQTEILEQVSPEHIDYMLTRIPMGRVGEPEEVAELIAWLASERCSFSTGAVFDVSGGRATY